MPISKKERKINAAAAQVKTSPELLGREIAKGMGFRSPENPGPEEFAGDYKGVLIGYARVSTEDQNLALQHDALARHGIPADRIYSEHISGVKANRPQLAEALKAARRGDTIVVWKLDRLGRSTIDLINLVRDMEARGVGFRSLTEYLDTTTAVGKLFFYIIASIAEFERNLISDRTKEGMKAARARGHRGGRTRKLDATKMKGIVAMLEDETVIMADVCATFGVSRSTIQRELKRKADEDKRRAIAALADPSKRTIRKTVGDDVADGRPTARVILQPRP